MPAALPAARAPRRGRADRAAQSCGGRLQLSQLLSEHAEPISHAARAITLPLDERQGHFARRTRERRIRNSLRRVRDVLKQSQLCELAGSDLDRKSVV